MKARRPPVEETASFLQTLLNSHGSNFFEVFFGPKARNNLKYLGGIQNVAIVLSGFPNFWQKTCPIFMILIIAFWIESHNIEDFARALKLTRNDLHNLRLIFVGLEQGDPGILSATGLKVTPHYH